MLSVSNDFMLMRHTDNGFDACYFVPNICENRPSANLLEKRRRPGLALNDSMLLLLRLQTGGGE
jgi:hypothetical protein